MKTILHICSDYYGTALYKNLFCHLAKLGFRNIVYVPKYRNNDFGEEDIIVNKTKESIISKLYYFGQQKRIFKDICKKINLQSIDFIHVHRLFYGGYAACKLSKEYNIPYIVTIRNSDVNTYFKFFFHVRGMANKIMQASQNIIFLSESYKKKVIGKYILPKYRNVLNNKSIVIPNGISQLFMANKQEKQLSWNKKNIRLIFVGTIDRNKNIDRTIKVCHHLIKDKYLVHFIVVGSIKVSGYKKLINKNSFIEYHDYSSPIHVLNYMRTADIFIMPSLTETFGLVYAEAMSQGLPVIYTKGQGFDNLYPDGLIGYAVEANNTKMIKQAVINIYNDYNAISERCLKYSDNYNWDRIALKYKQIYLENQ